MGSNSAAATAVNTCTTACSAVGSVSIPANYCQAGRTLRIYASGVYGTTSTPTYSMQFYEGTSTTKASDTAIGAGTPSITTGSGLSAVPWTLNYTFICYSTTSWDGQGTWTYATSNTNTTGSSLLATSNTDSTSVPTTAFNLYLFPAWGTSSASNTTTVDQWIVTGN